MGLQSQKNYQTVVLPISPALESHNTTFLELLFIPKR